MAKEPTDDAVFFAYKLKEARVEKNYPTMTAASDAYGTAQSHWSHWETALSVPHKSTLARLVDFFKVPADYFTARPPNWEEIKKEFLKDLQRVSRKNKDVYKASTESEPARTMTAGASQSVDDGLDDFMEIVALINNARRKVKDGRIDLETFKKQMKTVSDMIEVTTLGM